VKLFSALALVRRRDSARARALADKSEKAQASDTLLKVYWLPTTGAAVEFNARHPRLRLRILAWLAGMGSSEIAKKLAQNTRISFPHRKMAIPTSPYSRKPRRNTPNCSWAATSSAAFV
jgi:hypothetical protein